MKKLQLKRIIRESIKDLIKEQAKTSIRIYQGCNIQSGVNTGIFNNAGLSPTYTGIPINQMPPGSFNGLMFNNPQPPSSTVVAYEAMLTNNSNIIHDLHNNPSPGQVVRYCTCQVDWAEPNCICTCLKYLGSTNAWDGGTWSGGTLEQIGFGQQNLTPQPALHYNSCQECDQQGRSDVVQGCLEPGALNGPGNYTLSNGAIHVDLNGDPTGQCCPWSVMYNEFCIPTIHHDECCEWPDPPDPVPCKKCCCKEADIIHPVAGDDGLKEQISTIGGCVPGTTVMLAPTANPCQCPWGFMETPCKPPPTPLQERLQKLANIS